MEFIINSHKLGRKLTFSRPGRCYVYVDMNGGTGTLGNQICDCGRLSGNTITYSGDDVAEFEHVCRRWYRSYIRNQER